MNHHRALSQTEHHHEADKTTGQCSTCSAGRFEDLTAPAQFALWTMRMWVYGKRRDQNVRRRLREAFAHVGNANAAVWLETMMRTLTENLARNVIVHCVCDRRLSGDEIMLLGLLATSQADDKADIPSWISEFVQPGAIHVAAPLVARFGESLADAGVRIESANGAILRLRDIH